MPGLNHGSAIALGLFAMINAAGAQEADGGTVAAPVSVTDPRIDELDQQLRITQRKQELDEEKRAESKKTAATIKAGDEGFSLSSADGDYKLKLKALLQLDGRAYPGDGNLPLTDTFLIRRARPILDFTLFGFVDGRIMPDFGDAKVQIYDAYAEVKPRAWIKLRVGKFKPPVGLERLQGAANTFFNERAFPTALVPNRDVGAQLSSELGN
ncbi:MAG: porin, partial [Myxococcaceae bacterium]